MRIRFVIFAIVAALSPALAQTLQPIPPDNPAGDEVAIAGDNDPVAVNCERSERWIWKALNERPLKIVVTHSATWGTIWRSDTAFPVLSKAEHPTMWRCVCWKGGMLERAVEMLDKSGNAPPL